MTASDVHRAIDAVWRIESARLIAGLTRMVRDVGLAEDLAQDALVAALEQWPESGVPDNPGAWLMATAKHRAIDLLRRDRMLERKHEELVPRARGAAGAGGSRPRRRDRRPRRRRPAAADLHLPAIRCSPTEARVALTLRLLGGLTTDEIARAFLVPEPTIAQRIVRAKRTLAEAQVPFEVPRGAELAGAAGVGARGDLPHLQRGLLGDRRRRLDCARRCARTRCGSAASWPELAPDEPEVHGLVALMEIQASRLRARVGPAGEPVLLLDQDRARWDRLLIRSRPRRARAGRAARRRRSAPTRSRPRSRPATRGRARPRRPTGRASPRSTTRSRSSRRRRSWS